MRHARKDYQRFQDPATFPDSQVYDFLRQLADAYEGGDELALLGVIVDFFGAKTVDAIPQIARVRAFAARAEIPAGCNPVEEDEPVFLIRAADIAAPDAVEAYAHLAAKRGAVEVARASLDHASTMRDWQAAHGSKVPDLARDDE